MIKYIGSKRTLIPTIVSLVNSIPDVRTVLDAFSGTARVGHALKKAGYLVTANDHTSYAHALAQCYVAADAKELAGWAAAIIDQLNALPGRPGYFTETFCERARFFQPHNGERIDAIRNRINQLDPRLRWVLLASLMEAADRVDSTCGLQMAYLKGWAPRSYGDLQLRLPALLPGPGMAYQVDALDAVQRRHDLVYLDPPYNQHKYMNNYHIWETLVRWDNPQTYGVAQKRVDCREYSSPYNSKRLAADAIDKLIKNTNARYILLSYSDDGYVTAAQITELLRARSETAHISLGYKRYIGSQIGVHNQSGAKVGNPGRTHNQECMFLCGPDAHKILAKVRDAPTSLAIA